MFMFMASPAYYLCRQNKVTLLSLYPGVAAVHTCHLVIRHNRVRLRYRIVLLSQLEIGDKTRQTRHRYVISFLNTYLVWK